MEHPTKSYSADQLMAVKSWIADCPSSMVELSGRIDDDVLTVYRGPAEMVERHPVLEEDWTDSMCLISDTRFRAVKLSFGPPTGSTAVSFERPGFSLNGVKDVPVATCGYGHALLQPGFREFEAKLKRSEAILLVEELADLSSATVWIRIPGRLDEIAKTGREFTFEPRFWGFLWWLEGRSLDRNSPASSSLPD